MFETASSFTHHRCDDDNDDDKYDDDDDDYDDAYNDSDNKFILYLTIF